MFKYLLILIFIGTLLAQPDVSGKDTVTTESGLKYVIIEKGEGPQVQKEKEVAFHWTGYFENGESFGTSVGSEPFYYIAGKGQVIKGAEEALLRMNVGSRHLLILPPELAYGEKGSGETIPPNATLIFDYSVVSVTEPKISLIDTLYSIIKNDGIESAINKYYEFQNNQSETFAFREGQLNRLGYKLIREKKLNQALEVFKVNAKEYPKSANVFDSLGEAFMLVNNYTQAIINYKKSLELNPENENAEKMIKKMQEEK